ncbi:MAG: DUF4326 domain-containing protein [Neisseriaceae bacterium]|nr:MAG: DUF4326 domain-containing protein [Neisseriaceae bacterium]
MKYVVNCKKSKYDIFVGRPSIWGNPYVIGKDGTREEVIAKYKEYLMKDAFLLSRIKELKGKVLGCYCSPLPCHAEILAEIANET